MKKKLCMGPSYIEVIVVGDTRVGKTQLIRHYAERKFSETWKATIGADFLVKEVLVGDTLVTLQMWDTPSDVRFQSLGTMYCRGADACVLMYDVNDAESFSRLDKLRSEFIASAELEKDANFTNFVVIGNKTDLVGGDGDGGGGGSSRAVSEEQAIEWCANASSGGGGSGVTVSHFSTSAKADLASIETAFARVIANAFTQSED